MKVFWVLAYDQHYPQGGLGNVKGTFATLQEAEDYVQKADLKHSYEYVDIEDVSDML